MPINKSVKLCGAFCRTKNGEGCTQPAMKNGRCKMHGGKSSGPKTVEGKKRSAQANLKHGLYTKNSIVEQQQIKTMMGWRREMGK